jgi:hypothetical protein
MHDVLQVLQRACETIDAGDDKRVAGVKSSRTCNSVRPSRRAPLAFSARITSQPAAFSAVRCCGRQVGKSTAAAVCALNAIIYQAPATVVLISPSLRQSVELFRTFHAMCKRLPGCPEAQYETLQRLELANGSRIISLRLVLPRDGLNVLPLKIIDNLNSIVA